MFFENLIQSSPSITGLGSESGRGLLPRSAASFQQGAFPSVPPPLSVPIYSTPPPDDWIIRAYENCPAYLVKMNTWFQ